MAIPADLKFDVRVRERLLASGLVSEAEVNQHLEALPDLQAQAVDLTVKQPALQAESDRDIVIVRSSGARPPVAPVRPLDDDLDAPILDDDDDDDDDEDDDDEETKVVDREKIAAAEKKKAPEVEESKPEGEPEKTDGDAEDEP
ncbi:MAG TPA: hypothetical protein VGK73_09095 [Polyangiaceae bacterium]